MRLRMKPTSSCASLGLGLLLILLSGCQAGDIRRVTVSAPTTSSIPPKDEGNTEVTSDSLQGAESPEIAAEPVAIGGGFLIDPTLVEKQGSTQWPEFVGRAGSIRQDMALTTKVTEVELLAFDTVTKPVEAISNVSQLAVRLVASTAVSSDGSFRLGGELRSGELVFLRAPALRNKPVRLDKSKSDKGLVWLDADHDLVRQVDIPAAYTLTEQIEPSPALQGMIQRLRNSRQCRNCDLSGASLRGENLANVDLSGARLLGVKLNGSMLANADLRGADLRGADFSGSNLAGADFTGALIEGALFIDAFLETAINLNPP
jgi:hypothetical protein